MWEFFSQLTSRYGLAVVVIAAAFIAFAFVVRTLWNSNQSVNRQLRTLSVAQTDKIEALQKAHADKLEDLQERRVEEAKAVNDQLLTALREIDASTTALRNTMDALVGVLRGGGGSGRR